MLGKLLFLAYVTLSLVSCSTMKAPDASLPVAAITAPPSYSGLLQRYVEEDLVDYYSLSKNTTDLNKLRSITEFYATHRPPSSQKASLAWHLNAYNAWILHNIMDKYPTNGPLAGNPLFFEIKSITLSGKAMSFSHLEQKIIRPEFKEPRIHFALNCASTSCPPLAKEPFTEENLEQKLETLTRKFINRDPDGVRIDKDRIKLSKIFDWYAEDFGGKDQLITYVNRYRTRPLPPNFPIEFLNYDWALNSTR